MMHLLTEDQKDSLIGKTFAPKSYFSPIKDANGNWAISPEEVNQCHNPDFAWIKDLPTFQFEPVIYPGTE